MSTKKSFFKGVAFIAAAKYSGIIVSLIVTSILARILSPADFGVVAIATVFIVFFSLLSDLGIGPAIIQFKQLTRDDFRSIFGLSFWMAILLSLLFVATSPFIASFYGRPILINVCSWLSLQSFFTTLNIVPNALLLRERKFDVIAYRNVSIQVFCGALAVWAAYSEWGIYALILNPILSAFITLIVNVYYMKLSMRIIPRMAPIKLIFSFSAYQFLFNFVNYFGRNLDKLIIGKAINVEQLGYYEKSYRLMQLPIQNINGVFDPVLLPYLSESQNDWGRIHSIFDRMTRILFYISLPLTAMLLSCSREIILVLFGNQWLAAVPCFTILSISVATQIPICPVGGILQACNQTKLLFNLGNQNVAMALMGLIIATFAFGTIESIATAFVITAAMVAVNTFHTVYGKCFHSSARKIPRMIWRPFVLSILMIVVLKGIEYLIPMHFLVSLFVKGTIGLLMTFVFFQNFTDYKIFSILKQIKN